MPERDGYEVAAFVKGTPAFAHIPVLLLTGAFEPIDEGRAQAAGCDGVLVKPFEPQMVITRVKDLIAGKRPVQRMPAPQATGSTSTGAPAPPVATPSRATGSVDDYFDRLDAAFASMESAPPGARGRADASPSSDPSGSGNAFAEE